MITNVEAHVYRDTGHPIIFKSDNGKEVIKKEMMGLCNRFSIDYKYSGPHYPQANCHINVLNRYYRCIFRNIFLKMKIRYERISGLNTRTGFSMITILLKILREKTLFRLRLRILEFNTLVQCGDVEDVLVLDNLEPQKCSNVKNLVLRTDQEIDDHKTDKWCCILKMKTT